MSAGKKEHISKTLGPRAFLKQIGFALDKKPRQIDRLLLKSLSEEDAAALEILWAARNTGFSDDVEMYNFPKSLKSAALLFSYDWPRAIATMEWFEETMKKIAPTTVIEMGVGAGFLLTYLQGRFPTIRFQGIDAAENLCEVGSRLLNKLLITGDYLITQPDDKYDLVLCDFGFDNSHFKPSTSPHITETVAGVSYCSCCSHNLKLQFDAYLRAWRRWTNQDGKFAIAGRFSNFGMLRALVLSASDVGWVLNLEMSKVLTVKTHDDFERFPALVFDSMNAGTLMPDMESIAIFYSH